MNTPPSDGGKSNTNTSDSERQYMRKKLSNFKYPTMPKTNNNLRNESIEKIRIATNLFELHFIDHYHKLTLFNIEILTMIDKDNFLLIIKVNNYI